jgi:glycosyltransferase involved in cell wall biosynthesis
MASIHGKTILVISPQFWGSMLLSKHHYALELARSGNEVYFLNPPKAGGGRAEGIKITRHPTVHNLWIIEHQLPFPYVIKFHFKSLFHLLMRPHLRNVLRKIGKSPDIIWSFDLGNLYPLDYFAQSSFKIFHPVDEPVDSEAIKAGKGADLILSVTEEILSKYYNYPIPKHIINHGVASDFFSFSEPVLKGRKSIRVGFSGNLLRTDIDHETFLTIIRRNPDIIFECFGSYTNAQSNIGGTESEITDLFIGSLKTEPNVVLHGVLPIDKLAGEYQRMDAFLICYDVEKDQSRGTNYHKVLEYLSTGKAIVSNNITAYEKKGLLVMATSRDNNKELPSLFKEVVHNLTYYNGYDLQEFRRSYAYDNLYSRQIERIAKLIPLH